MFQNVDNDLSIVLSDTDDETASAPTTTFRDLADGLIGDAIDSVDFEPEPEGTTNANTSPTLLPTPRTNSGLAKPASNFLVMMATGDSFGRGDRRT